MAVWENGIPLSETDTVVSRPTAGSPVIQVGLMAMDRLSNDRKEMVEPPISGQDAALSTEKSRDNVTGKRADRGKLYTIADVLAAKTEATKKMSLGHGLQALFEKDGLIRFQFRLTQNGQDTTLTLGDSQTMSLDAARQEALELYRKVRIKKRKDSENAILDRTKRSNKKPDSRQYSTLRCFNDTSLFMNRLLNSTGIEREIRYAIWLQVVIPARLNDLLNAQWSDFTPPIQAKHERATLSDSSYDFHKLPKFCIWNIRTTKSVANKLNNNGRPKRFAYLSRRAIVAFEELKRFTRGNEGPVFPSLSSRSRKDCQHHISMVLREIWPEYRLDHDGFRDFFRAMANETNLHHPELIDEITDQKYRRYTHSDSYYAKQVLFILEHWAECFVQI